jgi:hypothetical protein
MSGNTWWQVLTTQQIDGTALTNTVTATSIIAPAARFPIPACLLLIGTKLRIKASGRISTVVTTPGNLTLDVRFGATTVVFNGGATALNIVAQTNATWDYEADLIVRSIGASTSGTILGTGKWTSRASLNAPAVGTTTGVGTVLLPDTAPVVGTGFDTTVGNTVDFFATFSVANAANSIQCHQYELTLCN